MRSRSVRAEIRVSEEWQEMMIADLFHLGFTGFEQDGEELIAYIPEDLYLVDQQHFLTHLESAMYPAALKGVSILEEQNWNEIWEASITPQLVGDFFIKPSWSDAVQMDAIELIIDPKMAFGTGYHATTRLMLLLLSDMDVTGMEILDAGTGTGILAIAALKRGAGSAFAFDVDPWSRVNAEENSKSNGCSDRMTIAMGDYTTIPDGSIFDVILANINRNVLVELIPMLTTHLRSGGVCCLSGLLSYDREFIQSVAEEASLQFSGLLQENEWIALRFDSPGGGRNRG